MMTFCVNCSSIVRNLALRRVVSIINVRGSENGRVVLRPCPAFDEAILAAIVSISVKFGALMRLNFPNLLSIPCLRLRFKPTTFSTSFFVFTRRFWFFFIVRLNRTLRLFRCKLRSQNFFIPYLPTDFLHPIRF